MDLNALPEILFRTIMTKKVLVKESDGVIMIMPVKEDIEPQKRLLGFAKGAEVPDSFFDPLSEEELQAWGL